MNKPQLLQSWIVIKANPGFQYEIASWTVEQEQEIERLKIEEIKLSDTELGRQAKEISAEVISVLPHLTDLYIQEMKGMLPDVPLMIEDKSTCLDAQLRIEGEPIGPSEVFQEEKV